jgi:hypothetical protein
MTSRVTGWLRTAIQTVRLASLWMLGTGRRFTVAALVAAMLVGVLLHGSGSAVDSGARAGAEHTALLDVAASPIAVVPATVRASHLFEIDLGTAARASGIRLAGLALALVAAVGALASVWWRLFRRDRLLARPLRGSSFAARRGPPATAVA